MTAARSEAARRTWADPAIRERRVTARHGTNAGTWTTERVERLKHLVADGVTFEAIGAEIGITKNAALGKATRMASCAVLMRR